jgi:hypothetical protein
MKKEILSPFITAMLVANYYYEQPPAHVAFYFDPVAHKDTVPHPWHKGYLLVQSRYYLDQQRFTHVVELTGKDTFEAAHPMARLIWQGDQAKVKNQIKSTNREVIK